MKRFALLLVSLCLLHLVVVTAVAADAPRLTLGKPFACSDYGGGKVCLVDADGKITWQIAAAGAQDAWVLPNGNILFCHVLGVKEVTREKEVVWEYKSAAGNEIHACQPLPDGKVMVAESGPMQIIEVDRQGQITKTVKLTSKTTNAHLQMRGARKLANGNYLVGQYGDGAVREYDSTGKIVWEFSQEQAFSAIRLPDGNTLISTTDMHSIIEVDPDGKVVWELNENDLPGNPLRSVAGMQRLPNGNTLVCNWGGHGHIGEQPQIFEVTRDKKVVGEIFDFKQFGTISTIFIMTLDGDPANFELLR